MKTMQSDETVQLQPTLESQVKVLLPGQPGTFSGASAIVLVHWQIRPECEAEFLHYWRTVSRVGDRAGLVVEFLSEVVAANPVSAPFITWLLSEPGAVITAGARHFVNVGIWSSKAAFVAEIAADFGDDAPMRPFELCRRRRMMLKPDCWRIGASHLPYGDSSGVR